MAKKKEKENKDKKRKTRKEKEAKKRGAVFEPKRENQGRDRAANQAPSACDNSSNALFTAPSCFFSSARKDAWLEAHTNASLDLICFVLMHACADIKK